MSALFPLCVRNVALEYISNIVVGAQNLIVKLRMKLSIFVSNLV